MVNARRRCEGTGWLANKPMTNFPKPTTGDAPESDESDGETSRESIHSHGYELQWLRRALSDIDRAVQAGNASTAKELLLRVQRVLASRPDRDRE